MASQAVSVCHPKKTENEFQDLYIRLRLSKQSKFVKSIGPSGD